MKTSTALSLSPISRPNGWKVGSWMLVVLVLLPIALLIPALFVQGGDAWQHLYQTVLADYVWNTAVLIVGVSCFTLLIGVSTAWLTSMYSFPLKGAWEWLLILPLAMPSYIIAFTYSGILDYAGPVQSFSRNTLGWKTDALLFFEIKSMLGAILVLSFVLYPYVYLTARAAFLGLRHSSSVLEVSRLLGKNRVVTFWRIALPLVRPAIVGGLSLVIMETLNDYGAVKYYGVSTLTTGIFRAWSALDSLGTAVKLSLFMFIFVGIAVGLEYFSRNRGGIASGIRGKHLSAHVLPIGKGYAASFICFLPVFFGFLLPAAQLLRWALPTLAESINAAYFQAVYNSIRFAALPVAIITLIALVWSFTLRHFNTTSLQTGIRVASLGYAIPGAVVGIGVLLLLNKLNSLLATGTAVFALGGGALVLAYVVRFMAVGFNPINSSFEQVSRNVSYASRILGADLTKTFRKIELPLIKSGLLSAALLVFVDVMKELPLTIILSPFNTETLSTRTFKLANDEMLPQAAIYALSIVLVGLVPVILLNRFMRR